MTEQELINTINALIDEGVQAGRPALRPKDIARRALAASIEGVFTMEAVTELVCQILTIRCEPWHAPPGSSPRLRAWNENVARIAAKPTVAEILDAGRQAGAPIAVTLACVRHAYPRMTEAAIEAEIETYLDVGEDRGSGKGACTRVGARGHAMIDDEAAWLADIGVDDPEVIEAHLEGARKLQLWEDNDFDRERSESHMRLFDDEMEDTDDGGPEEVPGRRKRLKP